MGEISEMHVAAYEAGLDPNDMDGADWADFYSENGPLYETDEEAAGAFSRELWDWLLNGILISRAVAGETDQQTLARLFPQLTEGQISGFFAVCEAIAPDDTDD